VTSKLHTGPMIPGTTSFQTNLAAKIAAYDGERMISRRGLIAGLSLSPLLGETVTASLQPPRPPRRLFAMDTAMVRQFPAPLLRSDLESIALLGYSGVGPATLDSASWDHLVQQVIPWCKELHLSVPAVYSTLRVTRSGYELDPGIARNIKTLGLTHSTLWLQVNAEGLPPSSKEADTRMVEGVSQAAELARGAGCFVSLYPHYATLIQTIPDALRVVNLVSRDNVGISFNLCHWLRGEPNASLAATLQSAAQHLQIVTLSGANRAGTSWKELIQPLDQGDFDMTALIAELDRIAFRGPIGLQGYDVAKNFNIAPQVSLSRSMTAWRRICGALAGA
jgi:sugar phosphate isomerase/epimerase